MSIYTHNLNIDIVDENDDTIGNQFLLETIYKELANKPIMRKVQYDNKNFEVHLQWERLSITNIQKHFIGVLFIKSFYSDKVLYETTKKVLEDILTKLKSLNEYSLFRITNWKLIFNISKLLDMDNNNNNNIIVI